jgi:hypothetical protein
MRLRCRPKEGSYSPDATQATWDVDTDEETRNAIADELAYVGIANAIILHVVRLECVEDPRYLSMAVWR